MRTSQQFTYVRCALNRSFGCPGYARIDYVTNTLITTSAHDHGEEVYKRGEYSLRNKLKRAAETSSERLREIFNETCREDPLKNMISFSKLKAVCVKEGDIYFHLSLKMQKISPNLLLLLHLHICIGELLIMMEQWQSF